MLELATPEAIGLDVNRWNRAEALLAGWCESGEIPAAGLVVGRHGAACGPFLFGRQAPGEDSPPVRDDAIFLIASITKPIVAMGAMLLVERGLLSLDDRVQEHLPGFGHQGKIGTTIRHLLTHTSGLPDMLPNNQELRAAHAPLSQFVEEICGIRPDFPPGRGVRYQSMGFCILGEVIQRLSGMPCGQFLRQELFEPLGMHDTALGAPEDWFNPPAGGEPRTARIVRIQPPEQYGAETDWGWNSQYWRSLGAPWGGLLTTPTDLARFACMMASGGRFGDRQILSPATVAAATRNQLAAMKDVPEVDRRTRPWGLGWRLNWPDHSANFGDLLGPGTYGHWGATGTVLWVDPTTGTWAVLLTTRPQEPHGRWLARASNALAAAFPAR